MKAITIISAKPIDLTTLSNGCREIGTVDLRQKRFVVEGEWGWFAVEQDQRINESFDGSQARRLRALVGEPNFALLEYINDRAAELAIDLLSLDDDIFIDNDHGLVASLGEIRRRIRAGENWQTAPN